MDKKNVHPLRVWRASQGLTQLQLAHKLGYESQSIVRGIETWATHPNIGEVLRLCRMSEGSSHSLTPWDFELKDSDSI